MSFISDYPHAIDALHAVIAERGMGLAAPGPILTTSAFCRHLLSAGGTQADVEAVLAQPESVLSPNAVRVFESYKVRDHRDAGRRAAVLAGYSTFGETTAFVGEVA